MSYANGTPFLNLPQTVGSDHRDWFDTNAAFADLDAKVKAAYEGSIDTASALETLQGVVSGISTDLDALEITVGQHTTTIGTIGEAITLINTALSGLNTTVAGKFDSAGIADPYDAEHGTYDVDDVVTYNGQRYVCTTAVTAAEPFDADKWTAEDVETVLDAIKSDLAEYTVIKERIADGVKTYSQLLDEMGTQTNPKYKFRMVTPDGDIQVADLAVMTNSKAIYEFRTFDPSTPLMNTHEFDIRWSGSTYEWYSVGTSGLTFQNRSSNVVANGTKFQYVI